MRSKLGVQKPGTADLDTTVFGVQAAGLGEEVQCCCRRTVPSPDLAHVVTVFVSMNRACEARRRPPGPGRAGAEGRHRDK